MASKGRKTNKSVVKRFKITGSGKVMTSKPGRRHIAATKNRKRKRRLAKPLALSESEYPRVKSALPFGGR